MGSKMTSDYNRISEHLRRKLAKNLTSEKDRFGRISMNRLASVCCVSHGTCGSWFRGEALPGLVSLYMLADYFGCSVYNLIEDDTDTAYYLSSQPGRPQTYADLFCLYQQMLKAPYLHFKSSAQLTELITDPIASFLIRSYFRNLDLVRRGNVPGSELKKWVRKLTVDFAIPISPASPAQVLEVFSSSRTFDEYADYLRTAKFLHEHAAQMQFDRAESRDEAAAADGWANPDFRMPDPSEYAECPEFYGNNSL